ncbi:MAG: exonuclease SbcCD subunit D C-terminal domain-containing protein [Bacteroidota bacterium]
MKVLHTADWHLGQRFLHNERQEEHQRALDWLMSVIRREKIELLLVAGDVFDIGNPPNYARRMYYRFLTQLIGTSCRHIVITGGNHDSPAMLNAPRELLLALNVHVVGEATERIEDEIIELHGAEGQLEAVVAAVPFLRDKDIRQSIAGESSLERIERIKAGIRQHYRTIGEAVLPYAERGVPLIATGHLFAKGAEAGEHQNNIYIGNRENIDGSEFPSIFDYIALGHLHRAQIVNQDYRIHYSGSLIPLSFSELDDQKVVKIIQFEGRQLVEGVRSVAVRECRKLRRIGGELTEVEEKLRTLHTEISEDDLPAWVVVQVQTDRLRPNLDGHLRDFAEDLRLVLLKVRTNQSYRALDQQVATLDLDDLSPGEVFRQRCSSAGQAPTELAELERTFEELQNWLQEEEAP